MKKLTASVLLVVLSSSLALVNAQQGTNDTIPKVTEIGEVVMTGAMNRKMKLDAQTSTATVVGKDKLVQAAAPNAIAALASKVPGLTINKTNSGVDGTYDIKIRGSRTLTGGTSPLVVIDGVISTQTILQSLPADMIESVTTLLGLQGAALYGSQGVNGAIIVTTKKGSGSRKARVNFNSNVEFDNVLFTPHIQKQYGQGWFGDRIHVENGAWGPAFSDPAYAGQTVAIGVPFYDVNGDGIISVNPDGDVPAQDAAASVFAPYSPRKNNVKEFFQTGLNLNNSLTVTGGNSDAYAGLSINRQDREFIVADDKLKKTSVAVNGGFKMGKLSFDGSVTYINRSVSTTSSDLYGDVLQTSSEIPITEFENSPQVYGWSKYYKNPYWTIKNVRNSSKIDIMNGTFSLGYKFNEHISIVNNASAQLTSTDVLNYNNGYAASLAVPVITPAVSAVTSSLSQSNSVNRYFYNDLMANINYDLTDNLDFKLTVGHNVQQTQSKITSVSGTGLRIPGLYQYWNLTNLTIPYNLNNNRFIDRRYAFFANLDLAYKDYLFVNATARYENSSKLLHSDQNIGSNPDYFYYSGGVSFMPLKAFNVESNTISRFVVKASHTQVGNDPVNIFAIENTVTLAPGFPFGAAGQLSFIDNRTPTDTNIRPEIVSSEEVSVGLGFFKNRLTLDASAYLQTTKDLITNQTTSSASGIRFTPVNVGDIRNKGMEVTLGATPIKSSDFTWDFNLAWSINRTKVLELANGQDEVNLSTGGYAGIFAIKGEEFPMLKATAYMRDEQGRIIINPDNGNPYITNNYVNFGRVTPNYTLMFNTNFKYKNFGLYAVLDYRNGGVIYSGAMQSMAFSGQLEQSASYDRTQGGYIIPNSVYLDAASGQYVANTSIKSGGDSYEGLPDYYGSVYSRVGENFILSGTAFRVRELGLSYALNGDTARSIGLTGLSFSVYARNPFYKFAKENKGYADPEASFTTGNISGLTNSNQYPSTRTVGFTTTINF
ncbi:SusC/RagA family TonB-linked outer membrane protein [Chryseobacterium caseinilyticum]|uniref:SusC/RagA family TonB-linked outer membrane protein n=1 Tax=Chryseobacterium caseinilyticum TaxID=2771428 RepID=A0ABR8ZF55_9FLAO|nr:SusC/RagA family TonB-linked outer membrane protein [Chryseobacterium caseinilyticum]MBD8083930.1 SusC/RagA family TonB-linked outer membrane protein [Chryseobacterium caseinilyticum]